MRKTIITPSILLAAACFAGCASDPSDGNLGSTESELSSNTKTAFNFFVKKGLTKRQSAGIVGNLMQESNVNPQAVQPGGPGRGIAQWSVGGRWDTSFHDNVVWYARTNGENRWALATQLAFTWYELHTVGGYGLVPLRNSSTIDQATIVFMDDFEKCGNCQSANRIRYAHEVYNAYAGVSAREATTCYSPTLGADVADATCVRSPDDGNLYQCDGGEWVDADSAPVACVEANL